MVDVYAVGDGGVSLIHLVGMKVIPERDDAAFYWADEVRTSLSGGDRPRYLSASTRGLESDKAKTDKYRRGWVWAFKLGEDGMVDDGARGTRAGRYKCFRCRRVVGGRMRLRLVRVLLAWSTLR